MITLMNGADAKQVILKDNEGIVLAWYMNQWVVWHIFGNDDGSYYCETGDYFKKEDKAEAETRFGVRAIRHMGWDQPLVSVENLAKIPPAKED